MVRQTEFKWALYSYSLHLKPIVLDSIKSCLHFLQMHNKFYKLSSLKQHLSISSQAYGSEVTVHCGWIPFLDSQWLKCKMLVKLCSCLGDLRKILFLSSDCLHNSNPCCWRTDVPLSLPAVSWGSLSATRGCLCSFAFDLLPSSTYQELYLQFNSST